MSGTTASISFMMTNAPRTLPKSRIHNDSGLIATSMKLIEYVLPVGLPVIFSAYFDLFDGLIQAYVFVFLTGLFIKESME